MLDMSNLGDATDVNHANSKTLNAFLLPVHAMFRHDCSLVVKPASTPRRLVQKKNTWRDSPPIDMLLSVVSVLVVVQPSSEVPEGLMNYPVYTYVFVCICVYNIRQTSFVFTITFLYTHYCVVSPENGLCWG